MRLWRPGTPRRERGDQPSVDWLVVGLGNPGARYAGSRHNIGRAAVERLAARHSIRLDVLKHNARHGRSEIAGLRVCVATPTVYMNESGRAVAPLARFYKVPPDSVLLVYDDMDMPLGSLRLRGSGGAGGHNGVASALSALGSDNVPRVRIGIGRPPPGWNPADFVLSLFSGAERPIAVDAIEAAADAVDLVLREGLAVAMNACN